MRRGLFGGSFDPIHMGHIVPVLEALRALELERVIYLPTARPPHKPDREFAPAMARYAMVELALLDYPELEVSSFELTPGERAFSIDSIEHFARLHPNDELVLLVGEDSLLSLGDWHRAGDIVERVEIGVLARPGFSNDPRMAQLSEPIRRALGQGRIRLVENEPVSISSSRLRRLLAAGEVPGEGMVPPLVLKYLGKYSNLYA